MNLIEKHNLKVGDTIELQESDIILHGEIGEIVSNKKGFYLWHNNSEYAGDRGKLTPMNHKCSWYVPYNAVNIKIKHYDATKKLNEESIKRIWHHKENIKK